MIKYEKASEIIGQFDRTVCSSMINYKEAGESKRESILEHDRTCKK